jgi:hypothetical protein
MNVQATQEAAAKLTCTSTDTCRGKLTLTAKSPTRKNAGKEASSAVTTIGSARFSISAGKTAVVKLTLNAIGRALLKADHGRLSTNLTILESSPASSQTQTVTVQLVSRPA